MPIPSPFFPRTSELCQSMLWKDWSGYYAARCYATSHEVEYFALRHAAGVIDVSPLLKYEIRGRDAGAFLAYLTVRDLRKLKVGRVTYLCWCDEDGKVVDEGTVLRLEDQVYRLTANSPMLAWLQQHALGFEVTVEDRSHELGVLALQGPFSRDILGQAVEKDLSGLKYFAWDNAVLAGVEVMISRTGYTGDLGYEIWMDHQNALPVWDALMAVGKSRRLLATGLDAMDVARVEAGFILNGVDYFGSLHCLIDSRRSTPSEIGLGWCVKTERDRFLGQAALQKEQEDGPTWALVGLEYDWDEFEQLFDRKGLPPQLPAGAWRDAVPVYDARGRQVGQATSGAWSPLLKKNLALASVPSGLSAVGTALQVEVSVEYERKKVTARVVQRPFFNPERKKA